MTLDIDPNIGTFGSLAVTWHGLMMSLGIAAAVGFTLYLARKNDFPEEHIISPALWAIIAGILGARASHVIDEWSYYSDYPSDILLFWEGGLGWFGGLVGGAVGGAIYAKLRHIPVGQVFDLSAPGVMLGLAIGRIGCTINGDVCGSPTSLFWGITYSHPSSYPFGWGLAATSLHPVALYELIGCLGIFILLWRLHERLKPDGSLFFLMIALYCSVRFFLSWLRAEEMEPAVLGPLHQAHIFCLVLFIGAMAILIRRKTSWSNNDTALEPDVELDE